MKPSSTATSRCVAAEPFDRNDETLLQERTPVQQTCTQLLHLLLLQQLSNSTLLEY